MASPSSSVSFSSARALNEFLVMVGWWVTDMSGVSSSEMLYVVVWVVRARMEPGVMGVSKSDSESESSMSSLSNIFSRLGLYQLQSVLSHRHPGMSPATSSSCDL